MCQESSRLVSQKLYFKPKPPTRSSPQQSGPDGQPGHLPRDPALFVQCERKGGSLGKGNDYCTMTTHLITMPWASVTSWPRTALPRWNNLCTHPTWLCEFFFLIPKMMGLVKGTSFEHRDDVKMALPTELETVKGGGLRQRENRDICPLDLKYTFCDTSPGVCLTHLILYYNISIRIIMCVILLFTLEFLSPRQLFFLSGIFNFIKLTSCNKTILQLILILIGLCTIEFYHNMFYAPPLI